MTTGEIITEAINHILDMGGFSADDVDFRARCLMHLRRAVDAMWNYRPWPWTYADAGACTALAGESNMFAPPDFESFGPYTKLWKVDDTGTIGFRSPIVVKNRLRQMPDATADRPGMWTLLGQGRLTVPVAPTVVVQGTPGAITYAYKIVALLSDGVAHTAASAAGSTSTGNALLTAINFNRITWPAVPRASFYDVYRTAGGSNPPDKIASALTVLTYDDVADTSTTVTPPTNDTTYSKQIVFAPAASTDLSFELTDYRMHPPVLVDEVISLNPADGDTLKLIPEQHHENVLLDYLRRSLMFDEGDERMGVADQDFKMALRDAWAEENPENLMAGMLPPSFHGHSSVEEG